MQLSAFRYTDKHLLPASQPANQPPQQAFAIFPIYARLRILQLQFIVSFVVSRLQQREISGVTWHFTLSLASLSVYERFILCSSFACQCFENADAGACNAVECLCVCVCKRVSVCVEFSYLLPLQNNFSLSNRIFTIQAAPNVSSVDNLIVKMSKKKKKQKNKETKK